MNVQPHKNGMKPGAGTNEYEPPQRTGNNYRDYLWLHERRVDPRLHGVHRIYLDTTEYHLKTQRRYGSSPINVGDPLLEGMTKNTLGPLVEWGDWYADTIDELASNGFIVAPTCLRNEFTTAQRAHDTKQHPELREISQLNADLIAIACTLHEPVERRTRYDYRATTYVNELIRTRDRNLPGTQYAKPLSRSDYQFLREAIAKGMSGERVAIISSDRMIHIIASRAQDGVANIVALDTICASDVLTPISRARRR